MDLDSVLVHKRLKKELGQYPAILTSHFVKDGAYYCWCAHFLRIMQDIV